MTATPFERITDPDGRTIERIVLPTDEDFLLNLLRDLFETHWQEITYGPIIQGAAFELRCAHAPKSITLHDGYLTVHFGRTHFHLCIGENTAALPALRQHRRTARAELFRGLDKTEAPITWGLRLFNGAGEQQMTVFFPNPFLSDDDGIRATPDWSRLELWETVCRCYAGLEPDGRDRTGEGFRRG